MHVVLILVFSVYTETDLLCSLYWNGFRENVLYLGLSILYCAWWARKSRGHADVKIKFAWPYFSRRRFGSTLPSPGDHLAFFQSP